MSRDDKQDIKDRGEYLLDYVLLDPNKYRPVLGSYLDNDTFFGRLIRWHERGEASHSSIIFVDKTTSEAVLEIHAAEGWGVVATEPGVLAHKNGRVEMRRVLDSPATSTALRKLRPRLGDDYEKPKGFVTKSRMEDPTKWFCSELADDIFDLQNCPSCYVSPVWARRSPKAKEIIGEI